MTSSMNFFYQGELLVKDSSWYHLQIPRYCMVINFPCNSWSVNSDHPKTRTILRMLRGLVRVILISKCLQLNLFTRTKFHQYSPSGSWVIKKILREGLITPLSKWFIKCAFMLQRTRYLKNRKIIINIRDEVRLLLKLKTSSYCQLWECSNTLRHWYAKQISTHFINLSAVFVHIPTSFCSKCIYF